MVKHDGLYGLVMTRLGPTLSFDHTYTQEQTNQLGIQLVHLLAEVHGAGYTYGDIKPDNIVVGDHGQSSKRELKLIDFGMSRPY